MEFKKNQTLALALTILFGFLGIHKFYLGKIRSGVLYLLFAWTFIPLLLSIIDTIVLVVTDRDKFNEKYNTSIK
ncbi:TM2 domain-containing protein [bacterium]|nr:TM2 domain-containing protein [bacterium]